MNEWGLNEYLEWLDDMAEQIAEEFESLFCIQHEGGRSFLYRPFKPLSYLLNNFDVCTEEPPVDVALDFEAGENEAADNHTAELKEELERRYNDLKEQRAEFCKRHGIEDV